MKVSHGEIWRSYAEALRPPAEETPAQFGLNHRIMHAVYCSEHPGPLTFDVFPWQPSVMNTTQEAIETGKKGRVLMKSGQSGGTDEEITDMTWLKVHFPGPQLFVTSTDKAAEEFGRERFENIIRDMPPLRKKFIPSRKGEISTKRFIDGKIQLCGGGSVNNLLSFPYKVVAFDEVDSLVADLGGQGDPVALAEVRGDSFTGPTLILAWAHPTTRAMGAGKLYYELSDQRRGFIKHACGKEFWINWFENVKCAPRLKGQSQESADRDPDCYSLVCPHCGQMIDDAERVLMLRAGIEQKSTLPPEEAAKKTWIGCHTSQLYIPHKTIRSIAVRYIGALGDENKMRVFVNKVLGDVFEQKTREVNMESLRALICIKRRKDDPEVYLRGQVPPGVLFLTAGQDSRHKELHYTIWGWGVRQSVDKARWLCGWLIDWGEVHRENSPIFTDAEYHVFDDLIYHKKFPATNSDRMFKVLGCAHDIQYPPTQIPIIRYTRSFSGRAFPARGASESHSSFSRADVVKAAAARKFKKGDAEHIDDPAMAFNTYLLKTEFYGMIDQRIEIFDTRVGEDGQPEVLGKIMVPRLRLPEDVADIWLKHTKAEYLGEGEKKGEKVWKHRGPNHMADCNTYALGLATYFDAFSRNLTADEYRAGKSSPEPRPLRPPPAAPAKSGFGWNGKSNDPSMG